ncbi:MAG: UDP-N-acetyl glucosamine 2-epimerase [Gemmatimonadales bacterium]|nr:MAG: UDP-N-acetyl glucosamine 2-epimerase [Gemmatimonadales bacterium]
MRLAGSWACSEGVSTTGARYIPPRMIALCYGTRPQVIKASVLRRVLAGVAPVQALDTGQHYDHAMNALLYEQIGVAPPDQFLEVGSGSHAAQTALILTRAEAAFRDLGARLVVVIGDTNSTLGAALAAAKLRIPVVHVEAGLRARDRFMAEELNRRVVDSVANLLCTPCPSATERMRAEHPESLVIETGDIARDVLLGVEARLPTPADVVPGLTGRYIFSTLHRAELTDDHRLLRDAIHALASLDLPVVLAVHPRTRQALLGASLSGDEIGALRLIPAVGYLESLALLRGAAAAVTDSGGVQREAYWLGVPCVTLRAETEWIETVELGANRLVPPATAAASLGATLDTQLQAWGDGRTWQRDVYGRGDAAHRVATAVSDLLA